MAIIEYTIKLTNIGEVEGFIGKVADELPKNATFNADLNKDWSCENGIAYSSKYAEKPIAPGETVDLTLTLVRVMTEDAESLVTNTVSIQTSGNNYGLKDSNLENNKSIAEAIIGPSQGEIAMYIVLTITILVIIGTGAYFVNKKVLKV